MLKNTYRVHAVRPTRVDKEAMVDGEAMIASVPCLECEIINEDGEAHTVRYLGKEAEAAAEVYKQDGYVVVTVEAKAD